MNITPIQHSNELPIEIRYSASSAGDGTYKYVDRTGQKWRVYKSQTGTILSVEEAKFQSFQKPSLNLTKNGDGTFTYRDRTIENISWKIKQLPNGKFVGTPSNMPHHEVAIDMHKIMEEEARRQHQSRVEEKQRDQTLYI